MYPTAEVRWFFPGAPPEDVIRWFEVIAPSARIQEPRTDYYLNLAEDEKMGIKVRGGILEVKRRYGTQFLKVFHPKAVGQVEKWRKWGIHLNLPEDSLRLLADRSWTAVEKFRRLRYIYPQNGHWRQATNGLENGQLGCEFELSTLNLKNQSWWTIALEAFNPNPDTWKPLATAAYEIFTRVIPPELNSENSFSYPKLLSLIV